MHKMLQDRSAASPTRTQAGALLIAQLGPAHRGLIEAHLRTLTETDQRLRFGHTVNDESISRYVRQIRFFRDAAFGAFDEAGNLIGFGHLAFERDSAEFAVSVDAARRGCGVGRALLERAAAHARNRGHQVLVMLYMPENEALAGLARRAGMQTVCDPAECRAYVGLMPPTPHSQLQEAWREAVAAIDLGFRRGAPHATSA